MVSRLSFFGYSFRKLLRRNYYLLDARDHPSGDKEDEGEKIIPKYYFFNFERNSGINVFGSIFG